MKGSITSQTMAIAVVIGLIFLLPVILSQWMESKAGRETIQDQPTTRERFCVSRLALAAVLFGNVVGGLFVMILMLIPNKGTGEILFFGGLALVSFVGTWITVIFLRSTFVVIDATTMEYISGRKRIVVERSSIKSVHAASGMIVVDTGTVPRHVMPMIFAGSYRLIALLREQPAPKTAKHPRGTDGLYP
jgi:hypothetical protein